MRLTSGAEHAIHLPRVYGHPDVPLTEPPNEAKFRRCLTLRNPPGANGTGGCAGRGDCGA